MEKKIEQRKEYQRMYYDVRAQEVKQELDRIEQQRIRNQLRNEGLIGKVQEIIEATQRNEGM